MYTKVAAPILGFVENMAHFVDADGERFTSSAEAA